jgi:hypothetical protein
MMLSRWKWNLILALFILAIAALSAVLGFCVWQTYFAAAAAPCATCQVHYTHDVIINAANATR